MIIVAIAIIVVIIIFALITLVYYINERYGRNFDAGVFIGIIIAILMFIEICLFGIIIEKQKPPALDVYRGNTTLEYTIRDSIKVDSVVVFKENYDEK